MSLRRGPGPEARENLITQVVRCHDAAKGPDHLIIATLARAGVRARLFFRSKLVMLDRDNFNLDLW